MKYYFQPFEQTRVEYLVLPANDKIALINADEFRQRLQKARKNFAKSKNSEQEESRMVLLLRISISRCPGRYEANTAPFSFTFERCLSNSPSNLAPI